MANELRIRRARPEDGDTIAAFNAAMALETEDIRLPPEVVRAGVERALTAKSLGHYYLAERDGDVVAQLMITYEWSDWRCALWWWIQSVYVVPEARRTGVYRALYAHVKTIAEADPDVCGIRLYVHHDNTVAQSTYETLGMVAERYHMYEVEFGEEP